jgi:hypothetical protein
MEDRTYKVQGHVSGDINTFVVKVDKGAANTPGQAKNFLAEIRGLLAKRQAPANPNTDYPSIEALVSATDFTDLAKQKEIIIKATGGDPLTADEKNELEGLLSFLDSFQDFCVDTLGEEEKRIFPNKTEA